MSCHFAVNEWIKWEVEVFTQNDIILMNDVLFTRNVLVPHLASIDSVV